MVRLIKLPTIGIASLFLLVVTTTSFAARSLESATILTHHGDTAELDDYTCAAWQGECPDGQVAASRDKYCHCGRKHCHCTKHHCCKEKEGSEDKVGDEGDEDSVDYTCATWNGECAEGQVAASKDKYCHCGRKHCHCTEHHCCKEKEGSGDEVGDEGVEDSVDYTCAAWNGECAEGQIAASKDKYCHCGWKHCQCTKHHCCKDKELVL
ncbi:hypothetical protein SARC_03181 [Sphaeroforma arctica JP610]|uniref:Uncharacterized protein n=1 Tax=Sphaeroforma arctica JP610 TaxID=667725 RepID=A0A0L0G6R7_9EUKA|nr:hypothetical protein SARC_03181 [Sphaeroforma arctica JP610]KNC84614.1 hypothetical protein SARC_03181 [Sphaeroforma arctica JP610]|eukprot:XP_014158516.1 hypothetical protein SARC_03181 [Sphaeroforma arctica JP610]